MSDERAKKVKRAGQIVDKSIQNLVLQQALLLKERESNGEPLEPAPRKRKTKTPANATDVPAIEVAAPKAKKPAAKKTKTTAAAKKAE